MLGSTTFESYNIPYLWFCVWQWTSWTLALWRGTLAGWRIQRTGWVFHQHAPMFWTQIWTHTHLPNVSPRAIQACTLFPHGIESFASPLRQYGTVFNWLIVVCFRTGFLFHLQIHCDCTINCFTPQPHNDTTDSAGHDVLRKDSLALLEDQTFTPLNARPPAEPLLAL